MTLARLPATGTLRYNTVDFNASSLTVVQGRPRLDEAGRVVKWIEYTIEVHGYVAASDTAAVSTDATLDNYRKKLLAVAGHLKLTDKGFGVLELNGDAGTSRRDALWGPIPEVLVWKPLGDKLGAYVEWRCQVHVPCERGASLTTRGPCAINYEWTHMIDQDGYSVQRIVGYLEIVMTRLSVDSANLPDSADNYRDQIKPAVPPGFQRVQQEFTNSKNKNRLNFLFVDKEIPAALPDGMTGADVQHEVQSDMAHGFQIWTGTISGTLTMARGTPKALVWDKFLLIVGSRLGLGPGLPAAAPVQPRKPTIARLGLAGFAAALAQRKPGRPATTARAIFLSRVSFGEAIFGRTSHFNVQYRLMGIPLHQIIPISGMWEPVDGTNHGTWKTSLQNSAWHERGWARLKNDQSDDALVDVCFPAPPKVTSPGREERRPPSAGTSVPPGSVTRIPEDSSWVMYRLRLLLEEDLRKVVHKPLNPPFIERPPAQSSTGGDNFFIGIERGSTGGVEASTPTAPPPATSGGLGSVSNSGSSPANATPGSSGTTADIIQTVSSPGYTIVLEGEAARVEHRVPCPALKSVGGVKPILAFRQFNEGMIGGAGGVPLHGAAFRLVYYLATAPAGNLPTPGNPSFGIESTNED